MGIESTKRRSVDLSQIMAAAAAPRRSAARPDAKRPITVCLCGRASLTLRDRKGNVQCGRDADPPAPPLAYGLMDKPSGHRSGDPSDVADLGGLPPGTGTRRAQSDRCREENVKVNVAATVGRTRKKCQLSNVHRQIR